MKIDRLFLGIGTLLIIVAPFFEQSIAQMPYDFTMLKFYGETHRWCSILYYSIPVVTTSLILLSFFILFFKKNLKKVAVITLLTLTIAPGIIVNSALKNHWGRARPYQVIRDGGTYSKPWQPHFNRPKDNSFPSGHVSVAMMLGVPLLALGRRKLGFLVSFAFAGVIAIVRVLQGGHYFSDVLSAMLIVWVIALLVVKLVNKYMKD